MYGIKARKGHICIQVYMLNQELYFILTFPNLCSLCLYTCVVIIGRTQFLTTTPFFLKMHSSLIVLFDVDEGLAKSLRAHTMRAFS
jgi:hypothetical protein